MVHTIGGFIALAGSIVLGPRLGRRFKRDGGAPMLPHDLTIAASGGLLLWFGWYGFNPGSTLSAMDFEGIGRVATNTTLAACAAGLTAMAYGYSMNKKWDVGFTVNGFLAGLVAITCPCYWVSPTGAIALGGVAGVLVVLGVEALEWLRIDDPIGAVPVHGFCGIWGTLSLGLFACGRYGSTGPVAPDNSAALKGLFYGGGLQLFKAQLIGSVIITTATFAVALAVMYAVHATGTLAGIGRRRTVRSGFARARHLGLSRVCHHFHWAAWRYADRAGACRIGDGAALKSAQGSNFLIAVRNGATGKPVETYEEKMTKLEAIVQPSRFEAVKDVLVEIGVEGMTISEVRGHGRQKGHTESYRGREYSVDLLPKIKVEVVVEDTLVDRAVDAIVTAASTGKIGDGKIFLSRIDEAIRIRNQERGVAAL